MLSELSGALLDYLFPPLCHVCHSHLPGGDRLHICDSCRGQIRMITEPHCTICSVPFNGAGLNHPCGSCIKHPPHFDAASTAFVYEGAGRELIHRFKYDNKIHLRRPLALLTALAVTDFVHQHQPDLIIPVPLHVNRLRSRGFNQAVLLGELLAREWGIPMARQELRRTRWTEPQISLAASQRRDNVRGAFSVSSAGGFKDRTLLLIDDVYTTGSTVGECAKTLKEHGAGKVVVVTAAHAIL
jgi:ComF family protein